MAKTALSAGLGGYTMQEKEKLPTTAWLSTVFIGIYTLFLAIAEAGIAVFLFYAKHITAAGTQMVSEAGTMSDYISGYFVLPGTFTVLLGSLTGVMAVLLAAAIFLLFLACPVALVLSCIRFKKIKLEADAWMKLVAFLILSVLSWIVFQSTWITVAMAIPAVLGIMTLSGRKDTK